MDIYQALPRGKERISTIQNEHTAAELKALINTFTFVLGERTHALIGAVTTATPCVAFTVKEDRRMHYIMENMFHRKTYNLNIPDMKEIKTLINEEWHNRAKTSVEMISLASNIYNEAVRAAHLLKESVENIL
jgi:polysaccharide pyruvyl transferase WcaK-like protein